METERIDKAFINLFKVILEENDYYTYLKKITTKYENFASNLYWVYERRQPMSIYGFLDSLENELDSRTENELAPDDLLCLYNLIINDFDRHGGWCD